MVLLKLEIDIVGFEITHLLVRVNIADKRSKNDAAENAGKYRLSPGILRMTPLEFDTFIKAFLSLGDYVQIVTTAVPDGASEDRPAASAPYQRPRHDWQENRHGVKVGEPFFHDSKQSSRDMRVAAD